MSSAEREFYDALLHRSKAVCRSYDRDAKRNNYAALFVLVLHLRQACNHPFLVFGKSKSNTTGDDSKPVNLSLSVAATSMKGTNSSSNSSQTQNNVAANSSNVGADDEVEKFDDDGDSLLGRTFLQSILSKLQKSMASNPDNITIDSHTKSSFLTDEVVVSESAQNFHHDDQHFECPICYETMDSGSEFISMSCGHRFCSECFRATVDRFKSCAICQQTLRHEDGVVVSSLFDSKSSGSSTLEESSSSGRDGSMGVKASWRCWGDGKYSHQRGRRSGLQNKHYLDLQWRSSRKLDALMATLRLLIPPGEGPFYFVCSKARSHSMIQKQRLLPLASPAKWWCSPSGPPCST